MCGIFAAILSKPSNEVFHNAMLHLRYRGYDSWGIHSDKMDHKSTDPYTDQILRIPYEEISKGILHTRWATNGEVNFDNAHPIMVKSHSIVNNGVMTNWQDFDGEFTPRRSDTDSEVLLNLWINGQLLEAKGNFAIIVKNPEQAIYAYRQGNTPLYGAIKLDTQDEFFTSDLQALPVGEYKYLLLNQNEKYIMGHLAFEELDSKITILTPVSQDKGDCVTLSELRESVSVLENLSKQRFFFKPINPIFVGSGSSYNAALFGKYLAGGDACIPNDFKWHPARSAIYISQSGESHDIISCAVKDSLSVVVTNNTNSSICGTTDNIVDMMCGVEQAVGATKSFIATCYILSRLAEKTFSNEIKQDFIEHCADLRMKYILRSKNLFFLGSDYNYPIALEAALKFKELALVRAEAFQTTEFKHGPLALIDDGSLVIIIGRGRKEMIASEQIWARGGEVLFIDTDVNPFSTIYELQYLAIKTALAKGINPDFPRNLAKSITVE